MPEYDELVKALRTGYCDHKLLNEAADVIEEMSIVLKSYRNRMKAGCDWIPVTERLPEKNRDVLICTEGYDLYWLSYATTAIWTGAVWLNGWDRDTQITKVTHWMPLPEPPREEE